MKAIAVSFVSLLVLIPVLALGNPVTPVVPAPGLMATERLEAWRDLLAADPYYQPLFEPASSEYIRGELPPDYDCSREEGLVPMEDLFGPGNVNGISGNGRLSAGFAGTGELTVMRWPNPSHFDQVCYLTPFLSSSCEARTSPRHGALENMGSFAGLHVRTRGGLPRTTWFRDGSWIHSQHYLTDRSNLLVTRSVSPDLGLTVETLNFVLPDRDVLARTYRITRRSDSPVVEATFIYFENLEPATAKLPYMPIADSLGDVFNDFAVLYHGELGALVHFRPQERDFDALPPAGASQDEIDRYIEGLDETFPFDPADPDEPVTMAVGGDFTPDGHQCGSQLQPIPGLTVPQGAFHDASDGSLSGVSAASGRVSAALVKTLEPTFETAELTVYITAAGTAGEAIYLLEEARARGAGANLDRTERFWEAWLSRAALPDTDDPLILATARSTLITMRNYFDADTGAFVASVTTQPPYSVNWPRDGVYFAYMADVAGFPEIAEANMRFQARIQRDCRDPESPNYDLACAAEPILRLQYGWHLDGTYDMSYYPDGTPGGPIFFEIDNAGLASWMMWEHSTFLDAKAGHTYLCEDRQGDVDDDGEGIYSALRRTADSLARCRTPGDESDLQCAAFEDDNFEPKRTLTGAISVYLALDAAIQAGTVCGENPDVIDRWQARLDELTCAIEENYWNEEGGYFRHAGPSSYLLWPARYPLEPECLASHGRHLFERMVPILTKEARAGSYHPKFTLALAKRGWDTGEPGRDLEWAIRTFNRDVPVQETRHYGEGYLIIDKDGDGVKEYDNRVAIPHLWEGTLNYLSAMAYYGARPPEGGGEAEPTESAPSEGRCGCSVRRGEGPGAGPGSVGTNLVLVLLPVGLVWRLRRRAREASTPR